MSNERFDLAFAKTIGFEGGYTWNQDDPGGETKWGISARSYPDLDIRALTIAQAKEIYRSDFWEPIGGDRFDDQEVGCKVFDIAVNAGIMKASEILQRAINYLTPFDREIEVDKKIGDRTIHAAAMCNQKLLLLALRGEQFVHYRSLVNSTTTHRFETFAGGWLRRAMA